MVTVVPQAAWAQLPKLAASRGTNGDSQEAKKDAEPPSPAAQAKSAFENLKFQRLLTDNSMSNWGILLGAIFVSLVAGRTVAWILRRSGERWEAAGWQGRGHALKGASAPASLALLTGGLLVGLAKIVMSPPLRTFSSKTLLLLFSIAFFWYAFNLAAVVDILLKRRAAKTGSPLDRQIAPLIRKTLRVFLVVIGVLFVIDTVFEGDIGAWLAGLGIAGLAVSLAAQDSLKNLFGSVAIILDRPFQVGERIVFGGYDGSVEEIGFRSTKIRTLNGHLVNVPNANIVNGAVENIGRRPFIKRILNVTITYDTPRDKLERAVQIIAGILEEEGIREPIHPLVGEDEFPPRVFFNDYNADSLNILVIYWYAPAAYWDFLAHAQQVNLRLFEEFEREGIEFAFPTQTLYLAGDSKRQLALRVLGSDLPAPDEN